MPTFPTFFDGRDLHRLLMAAPTAGAEGLYEHAHWSVRFAPDTPQPLQQLASVHEAMHMALNDSTAFGSLLHVYAALLRGDDVTMHDSRLLAALIGQCLKCHEAFATWTSLTMVGRGHEDASLLAGYPHYLPYFEAARQLLRGLDAAFVRNCAVNAAFRLCMQGTGLDEALRAVPQDFDPERLLSHTRPDLRLEVLTGLTDESFWASAWDGLVEACDTHRQWERLVAHRAGAISFADLGGREMDSLESDATRFFYDYLARALAGVGVPSLEFNGHQGFTAELIAAFNDLYGDGQTGRPLVAAPAGPVDDEREQIERFAHERYRIRDERFHAEYSTVSALADAPLADMLAGPAESRHLFIVVRQGLWLLQHYEFDAATTTVLEGLRYEPVVVLRRRLTTEAGARIELVRLESPEDFAGLLTLARATPIYANVSLASLAIQRWAARWLALLQAHCRVSLLFDLSPFKQLEQWSDGATFDIRRAFLNVSMDGSRHAVFLCQAEDGRLPPLLAPCSEMTAKAIGYHLDKLAACGRHIVADRTLVKELAGDLGIWLGHLLREETAFDFLGAQSVATVDTQSQ
ncbi:MAG: hypothetical protein WCV99_23220 [Sterolibacterium sp.]|jgi:hypothetical protein